ncbi:MAG: tyrosine-type recombinase/integrase [Acidobacteriota bacterium]
MSSIYKTADGRWRGEIQAGKRPDGRSRVLIREAKTRRQVEEKLAKAQKSVASGIDLESQSTTLSAYLHHWLTERVTQRVKPATLENYEYICRKHLLPELGEVRLNKLTPQAVQELLNRKHAGGGISVRTVRLIHSVLRIALNLAVRWRLVERNAADSVDLPRQTKTRVSPFIPDELVGFLSAIEGDRLRALYLLAVGTGMRQGEILALRWEDVDLVRQTVTIRHSIRRAKGKGLLLGSPKSESSRRLLSLPILIVEALTVHKEAQEVERAAEGPKWKETGHVFTTFVGTPIDACNLGQRFRAMLQRHGLRRMRFHDLRHTCASLMLHEGQALKSVSDLLGHSQISVTADFYGHTFLEAKQEAARKMETVLRRAITTAGTTETVSESIQ